MTPIKASEVQTTPAFNNVGKPIAPIAPTFTFRNPYLRYVGASANLISSQKRKAAGPVMYSPTPKRVKMKASISNDPEATRPIADPGNTRYHSFNDSEWHNSVQGEPERPRSGNSKALLAVYEGILETLARVDLDVQKLEEIILDHGHNAESLDIDDNAKVENPGSQKSFGVRY
ncbi:uncharacterized protein PGRI_085610 [Penicillium griseofulvum]|uniref:Uncharacterized protein n=1 Tax=Penicillium patulum TaxID=5078 RepID=A0A135LTG1_PENPA|nr:uncharacterized protein PGRI_085610 [Penicillium griseofulvum]KXG52277.1 hypothetical protein PGRI_085610 [Penicillium griseofulvum]